MRKIGILLLVLMIAPMVLFAGGGGDSATPGVSEIRFGWWGNVARDDRTNAVIRLFQRMNPDVRVEPEAGVAFAAYWDRLATQTAAGNLPDVIQQDVSWIMMYNNNNQLENLDPFVQRGLINLANIDAGAVATGRLGNTLAGLIMATNAWGMIVDPAVLTRAGVTINDTTWTWADYEAAARQIHQRTGVQTIPPFNVRQVVEHISRQFGSPCFNPDNRTLGISTNQNAYNAVRDWINMEMRLLGAGILYDVQDAWVQGKPMAEEPLPLGRTWNQMNWSNQLVGFQDAARRNLQYIMFPRVQGAPSHGTYYRASMFLSMTRTSRHKDAAARLIDFFINDMDAGRILLVERGAPVNSRVRADISEVVTAGDRHILQYLDRIAPFTAPADPPYPPGAGQVENPIMRNAMLQIMLRQLSVDDGIALMVSQSHAELARQNP
jgi:multiple sugar transport system substrate-binding protein